MAQVNLGVQLDINTRNIQGWKLGSTSERITDLDVNKAVVLDNSTAGTLKLAADSDEIRGFIESIEPASADGQTFGSVVIHAKGVRQWVTGTGLNIGDLVVSAAQEKHNTANKVMKHPLNHHGLTTVKSGAPTTFKWQVIRVVGTDQFLIEAI